MARLITRSDQIDKITRHPLFAVSLNTFILTGLAMFKDGITIPFMGFMTRHLSMDEFGVYSLATTYAALLLALFDLGAGRLLTRELSQETKLDHRIEITNALITPRYYALPIALLAIIFYCIVIGYSDIKLFSLSFSVVIAFGMAFAIAGRSIFHAFQQMEFDAFGIVGERLITIILSIVAIHFGYGLLGVLAALLIGQIADTMVSWTLVRQKYGILIHPRSLRLSLPYLRMGWPILISVILTQLIYRANFIVIERTLGDAALALFNVAFYFFVMARYLPQQFSISILPFFSRLALQNTNQLLRAWRKLAVVAAGCGLVCSLGLSLLADLIVRLLFSVDYLESAQIFKIMAYCLPFSFVSTIDIQVIISANHEGILAKTTIIATIISIALGIFFIPRSGLTGAAISTVVTEFVIFVIYTIFILLSDLSPRVRI